MNNFVFYSPTEFVFGKNTEVQVGALARKYGAQKVMIVFLPKTNSVGRTKEQTSELQ